MNWGVWIKSWSPWAPWISCRSTDDTKAWCNSEEEGCLPLATAPSFPLLEAELTQKTAHPSCLWLSFLSTEVAQAVRCWALVLTRGSAWLGVGRKRRALLLCHWLSVNSTPCSHILGCSELAFGGVSFSTDYIREFRVSCLLFQTQGDSMNTFPPSRPAW